jgi:polyphosphate glucokinase
MRTLSVDVGGSHVKASVLSETGAMAHETVKVETPEGVTPARLVTIIGRLAKQLPSFGRISVGFPGVVREGVIRTAPNLGTERFAGFDLGTAIRKKLRKPTRVCNDADMQGYGAITGRGVEVVITLGTGFGSSIFENGRLGPHLELAHHNFRRGNTYEDDLGEQALERTGKKKWNAHLEKAIESLRGLTCFDHLFIGGGNSRHVELDLPKDVSVVDNAAGILGGVRLWDRAPKGRRRRPKSH